MNCKFPPIVIVIQGEEKYEIKIQEVCVTPLANALALAERCSSPRTK